MEMAGNQALKEIREHVAICAQQNVEVLQRMGDQDAVLNIIRDAQMWMKRGFKFGMWALSSSGGFLAALKIYEMLHK